MMHVSSYIRMHVVCTQRHTCTYVRRASPPYVQLRSCTIRSSALHHVYPACFKFQNPTGDRRDHAYNAAELVLAANFVSIQTFPLSCHAVVYVVLHARLPHLRAVIGVLTTN